MNPLKIAVIGGGSTYTPELIEGFLAREFPVREVALVDADPRRLEIVGGLAARMVAAAGGPFRLTLTGDRAPALDGADAVITQLRVGGQAARILDERVSLAHGVVGQETTGPGGFAKALRTIPVILDINREMAARCPDAWLVNFTNPSGLITEALQRHGRGRFVGLCNFPLTLKMNAAKALQVDESRITLAYFGLNHLSWARVLVDGADRTEELIEIMLAGPEHRELSGFAFAPERLRALGLIPSGYLRYYYETERMVRELREAPQTRGELVRDVEARLLASYADAAITAKPPELQQRGGAWYSTAAVRLIRDLWQGEGREHILNLANDGALPFLPAKAIVETPVRVNRERLIVQPVLAERDGGYYVGEHRIADEVIALIRRVKEYEVLAVRAAVERSREIARQALAAHPLLDGQHAAIPALLEDLLAAHQEYIGW
ncbi:MAG: 6-phospho-beta-glucosidase [Armatimonadota bacterium]